MNYNSYSDKNLNKSLNIFFNEDDGLFKNFRLEYLNILNTNIDNKYLKNFTNEPFPLEFNLNTSLGKSINFITYIDIDKIYKILEENKYKIMKINLSEIDMIQPLKTNGVPRILNKPILLLDGVFNNIFIQENHYYSIDGRNRIKNAYLNNQKDIEAYIVNDEIILKCAINNLNKLALEILLKYNYYFGRTF
ncbi:hypothetical protein [Clostridium sp.]|uniref:hypothetical protein n=1 Tax=Clostridium sp. TaxID=1506 RepID=UPI0026DD1C54|nr:hypothetical protein [Clostridium sp.]MDO5040112.1 hypothetical protein [Clostridium sp.]